MLKSMKLTTQLSTFSMPEEGEIVKQILTVKRDGRWWISEYEWTKECEIKKAGTWMYRTSGDNAAKILDTVENAQFDDRLYIMDGGEYDLVREYDDGRIEKIHGNVSPYGMPMNDGNMSAMIRELLSDDGLFVFDC